MVKFNFAARLCKNYLRTEILSRLSSKINCQYCKLLQYIVKLICNTFFSFSRFLVYEFYKNRIIKNYAAIIPFWVCTLFFFYLQMQKKEKRCKFNFFCRHNLFNFSSRQLFFIFLIIAIAICYNSAFLLCYRRCVVVQFNVYCTWKLRVDELILACNR